MATRGHALSLAVRKLQMQLLLWAGEATFLRLIWETTPIIHKSKQTKRWLKKNPKFCLVFQPVYSPWVNHIKRLCHKLHESITRNHQCRWIANLLTRVKHFMDTEYPFPGKGYGTAKV